MSGGVANNRDTLRHVAGDNCAGPDHCIIADVYSRKDDGAAAYPNILSDRYGTAELGACLADCRIARMIGRVYLDSRPDLRSGADGRGNDVKNDAIEVDARSLWSPPPGLPGLPAARKPWFVPRSAAASS